MTDELDGRGEGRDAEAPVIKVTDKRRFADVSGERAGDEPAPSAGDEAPSRDGSHARKP